MEVVENWFRKTQAIEIMPADFKVFGDELSSRKGGLENAGFAVGIGLRQHVNQFMRDHAAEGAPEQLIAIAALIAPQSRLDEPAHRIASNLAERLNYAVRGVGQSERPRTSLVH